MRILAIETSGAGGSVAVSTGAGGSGAVATDAAIVERTVAETREQTGRLLPMIDEALAAAGIGLDALDALAFGQGPGSFTGLRVAAAVVQGLGLASGVPVVPVSSMAGLMQQAYRCHGVTNAVVCIDARMDEVYSGHFAIESGLAVATGPEAIGAPEAVGAPAGRYVCIGDAFARYPERLAAVTGAADAVLAGLGPLARDLLPLAAALGASGRAVAPVDALPTYLRDSTAWKRL